jgi:hypothetical protein
LDEKADWFASHPALGNYSVRSFGHEIPFTKLMCKLSEHEKLIEKLPTKYRISSGMVL